MTRRGFSLIEVLISVAILAFVMAGISAVLIVQSKMSAKQELQRSLEENGRMAILDIARAVRQAGYGIAPTAAFDFDRYACATPGTATSCNGGGRDRFDAPDELVVSYRDPSFYRNVTSITGGAGPWTASMDRALTAPLDAGRVIQLLCTGAEPSSYLAVSAPAIVGDTTLLLRAVTTADGYYPAAAPSDGCFGSAAMMLVVRERYYIAPDPSDALPSLWRDRGAVPPVLLDRGIEDLQITYQIGAPPAGSPYATGGALAVVPPETCAGAPGWIFGACTGTAEQPSETATAPDWRNDPYDWPSRYTANAANVRAVGITVVAISRLPTPDGTGDAAPALGNRAARPQDKFKRSVLTVTEQTPNLLTRAHFLPPVFAQSNVGGG
jgi:prepilin-type N-terminal cleavage/methylation domain-containing protein